jgi:hypothetical protein
MQDPVARAGVASRPTAIGMMPDPGVVIGLADAR